MLLHLQAQRNVSIPVLVILLEYICHALQTDTCLDKQVETERIAAVAVICAVQQSDELLRETVSKGNEGFVEFGIRYTAAVVLVEAIEKSAPGRKEPP